MTTWPLHRLDDLCEVESGPSGAHLGKLSMEIDGVPVISPPDLTVDHVVDTSRIKRIGHRTASGLKRFQLRPGDLIYVRQGTLGRRALAGPEHADWIYGAACLRIRPRSADILPEYLLTYLGHQPVQNWLLRRAHPGTVQTLTVKTVAATPVVLPEPARQGAVAGVVAEINAQIRIQHQMIDRLESLRPALLAELLGSQSLDHA